MNYIFYLIDDEGNKLIKFEDIKNEVVKFYLKFMGLFVVILLVNNQEILVLGNFLFVFEQRMLCFDVFEEEIYRVLFVMDENKIFGIDGFNVCFFKKLWEIIKYDIFVIIKEFFLIMGSF